MQQVVLLRAEGLLLGPADRLGLHREVRHAADAPLQVRVQRLFFAKFCKFLEASFSAVSKRKFARKYAFDSIFQALQDVHTFAPLQTQHFRNESVYKTKKFRIFANFCKILQTFQKIS